MKQIKEYTKKHDEEKETIEKNEKLLRLKNSLKLKKMQKYVVFTIFRKNFASTNFCEFVIANDFAITKIHDFNKIREI